VKKKNYRNGDDLFYGFISLCRMVATPFIECSVGIGNIPTTILANITITPSAQIIKVNRLLP